MLRTNEQMNRLVAGTTVISLYHSPRAAQPCYVGALTRADWDVERLTRAAAAIVYLGDTWPSEDLLEPIVDDLVGKDALVGTYNPRGIREAIRMTDEDMNAMPRIVLAEMREAVMSIGAYRTAPAIAQVLLGRGL